jgi:hypothetical protein
MAFDYSDAPEQRENSPIPAGTVVTVQMTIRSGGAGDGGWLTRSKDGGCEMIDAEFVVVDGPHARRKFWERMVVTGTTDGQNKAAEITRSKLRAMLESGRGIKPTDMSEAARRARVADISDFEGLRFIAKVGVEKGGPRADGNGDWPDKNRLDLVITPERKDWHAVEQPPRPLHPATPASKDPEPVMIAKPAWAS